MYLQPIQKRIDHIKQKTTKYKSYNTHYQARVLLQEAYLPKWKLWVLEKFLGSNCFEKQKITYKLDLAMQLASIDEILREKTIRDSKH